MEKITREATDRTPAVVFDFEAGKLSFEGESYPEDASAFYGPLHNALSEFLKTNDAVETVFDIKLAYFNSSSAKVLMNLFSLLEDAAESGKKASVNWYYSEDDDTMQEFGEDFASDMEHLSFNLCTLS